MRLDTVADESRKKKADCVARSPSRLCSRDGKICCYGDALNMIFLLAFVLCFLLFVFHISFLYFLIFSLHSGSFIFFLSLLCSSHLLLSASTYFIVRVLFACVICTLPHVGVLLFFILLVFFLVALISRVASFLLCSRTRYAST